MNASTPIKSYCITDSVRCNAIVQKHHPDFILYRDKQTKQYARNAKEFVTRCSAYPKTKLFLHQDYTLASELGVDGVHLTSQQFDKIEAAKRLDLEVIVSTHSLDEVLHATTLGADYVTWSPIFASPNKGKPKGLKALVEVVQKSSVKVFALGGIVTQKHIKQIEQSGAYGFASMRYFIF
ncbi:MAG: thiamine phosphate synthase [Epsilonproteobacteria bacterium]|nr:thiamine phosphate synthase [Campylobacterota bacterium]